MLSWYTKAKVWISVHWDIVFLMLSAVVGVVLMAVTGGQWRAARKLVRVDKQIENRNDKARTKIEELERRAEVDIIAVENHYDIKIEEMKTEQAREYQLVRQKGPKAIEAWLRNFDKGIKK